MSVELHEKSQAVGQTVPQRPARALPSLVLCNGPGTCVPICAAALLVRLLGIKYISIVYVESVCRVESLSLSGKIMLRLADHFLVQWPGLTKKYPRAQFIGRLC